MSENASWHHDAIIYEAHVRAFRDDNGDGVGDFKGLTSKHDVLRDLGITALWLLPFYPSPLRDDGYDIADYKSIHPAYGTMRDNCIGAGRGRAVRAKSQGARDRP